jgi:ribulose-phosphate 3-epimerase
LIDKYLIAPSILSANFSNLKEDINMVEIAGADWLHIDVMDGHFVPNITVGPLVVKAVRPLSKLFFDVHLMIEEPEKYWKNFVKSGADLIVFHKEINGNIKQLIKDVKEENIKVGISIKPKTSVKEILEYLPLLDVVLIMTVEPGFGGQSFMEDMLPKISYLREVIDKNKYNCLIEVDGGINIETAKKCLKCGANVLVSGNSIFASENPTLALRNLKNIEL